MCLCVCVWGGGGDYVEDKRSKGCTRVLEVKVRVRDKVLSLGLRRDIAAQCVCAWLRCAYVTDVCACVCVCVCVCG